MRYFWWTFPVLILSLALAEAKMVAWPFLRDTASIAAADIYVDPAGNDACNGTSPNIGSSGACAVATLDRARRLVATQINRAGGCTGCNRDYTVRMRGGRYAQATPVYFSSIDTVNAPYKVQYIPYGLSDTPVIEGGYQISGWTPNGDGTYSVDLVAGGYWPGAATGANAKYYFGALYVDAGAGQVRRWPPIYPDRGAVPFFMTANSDYVSGVGAVDSVTFSSGGTTFTSTRPTLYSQLIPVQFAATGGGVTAGVDYYIVGKSYPYTNPIEICTNWANCAATKVTFTDNAAHDLLYNQSITNNQADNILAAASNKRINRISYNASGSCPNPLTSEFCPAWLDDSGDQKLQLFYIGKTTVPVASATSSQITLRSQVYTAGNYIAGTPWRRVGFQVDLAPGHFYLSRAGVLKYWPLPSEAAAFAGGQAKTYAPIAKEFIRVSNTVNDAAAQGQGAATGALVGNLTFKGIGFEHTNTSVDTCEAPVKDFQSCGVIHDTSNSYGAKGAITLIGAANVSFDGVNVFGMGEAGIVSVLGSNHNTITNSRIKDLGGPGIMFGGGLSYYTSYLYAAANDLPTTPYFKRGDAGPSNVNDGYMTISNNEISDTGKVWGYSSAIAGLAHDHLTMTHNDVHHTPGWAVVPTVEVSDKSPNVNDTRSGSVTWNYIHDGGVEEDPSGVYHAGYSCIGDQGLYYRNGNPGGDGTAGQLWVEQFNVMSGMSSCAFQNTIFNILNTSGFDGFVYYADLEDGANTRVTNNVFANGKDVIVKLTGGMNEQFRENIVYASSYVPAGYPPTHGKYLGTDGQISPFLVIPTTTHLLASIGSGYPNTVAISAASCTANVVSITTSTPYTLASGKVMVGATLPDGYNGNFSATVVDGTNLTYPVASCPGVATQLGKVGPGYIFSGPYYPTFSNNVVAWTTNGQYPTSAYVDRFYNFLSTYPGSSSWSSNLMFQYDAASSLPYFENGNGSGPGVTIGSWQALANPGGGTKDSGSVFNQNPNLFDTTFRSSKLFATTGGATLCSDGAQRSPACGLPGGFMLWDPSQAGRLP